MNLKKIFAAFLSLFVFISVHAASVKVLVEFEHKPKKTELGAIRSIKGLKSIKLFDDIETDYFSRLYEVFVEDAALSELSSHPAVRKIEYIYEVSGALSVVPTEESVLSNDPFATYQWGLFNNGQKIIMDIDDIHSITIPGKNGQDINISPIFGKLDSMMKKDVVVAVLDSGVDIEHPDLKDNIFRNTIECDENGNLRFKPEDDRDENGLKGDCMGWNFTSKGEGDNRPLDDKGHGTHVAGIMSSKIENASGVSGMASRIKILPVKIMKKSERLKGKDLVSFTDRISKGILYAVKMKVDVINLSLGWPRSIDTGHVRQAVQTAIDNGIIVVAAAGNNNIRMPIYPCSYKGVICVGASTIDGKVATFSNYGGNVDLLAPGEKILSTFPTKFTPSFFSVEGYEIKNGTSQAAPYVSGAAAILRSVNPETSKDEILARLWSTAKTVETDKHFMGGLIQINDAIKVAARALIRPIFKGISSVPFVMGKSSFTFDLPVKNYWKKATNIKVVLELDSDGVDLGKKIFSISSLGSGEIMELPVEGQIVSPEKHSEAFLTVRIFVENKLHGEYVHNIYFARQLQNEDDVIVKPVNYDGQIKDLVSIRDGKLVPKFFTVGDRYGRYKTPEYYLAKKSEKGQEMVIMYFQNGGIVTKKRVIEFSSRILNVHRYDLNYDGKPDYFVRSVGIKDGKKFILYSYLDENLEDLFSEAHFAFTPEMKVFLDINQMGFLPVSMPFGKMAVPIWAAVGTIPKASRNPDPWENENLSNMRHVYYFSPDIKHGDHGLPEFIFKIFDDHKFVEKVREDLNLYWTDTVDVLGVLFQNQRDLKNGKLSLQISSGGEFLRDYHVVRVEQDFGSKLENVDFGGVMLEGNFKVPVIRIDENGVEYFASTAFVGLQNDSLAQYLVLKPHDTDVMRGFRYEHERKTDHILGVMASFIKDDINYAFFQTKSNIVLKIVGDGIDATYMHPVNRVSFIPGNTFNELYWPVTMNSGDNVVPAYYIDATELYTGHVYVVAATPEGLISPIKTNIFIPQGCYAMNPVKVGDNESFSIVCKEGNKVVFRYLSI